LSKGLSVFSGCAPALLVAALVIAFSAAVVILRFLHSSKEKQPISLPRLGGSGLHIDGHQSITNIDVPNIMELIYKTMEGPIYKHGLLQT
jgi:hypothetical protein